MVFDDVDEGGFREIIIFVCVFMVILGLLAVTMVFTLGLLFKYTPPLLAAAILLLVAVWGYVRAYRKVKDE